MKPENAIEVHEISKAFKVYLDKGSTMKERVIFKNRRRFENRTVLDHNSFEVRKGEAVGLIGHNGCGKSTTLKLLTRIMYPDSGTIEMKGRVSSLIELGAGFHPDMSGRENIYINASIFGLTKKEIDERLDDIIAFSELEDYIENPVRTYSSGMYMRLAFAVAINVDADILLIDEILAVGDANFQTKCFNRMREIKSQGTTIVLVSHNLGQVEQLCDRAIWINEGRIASDGEPKEVDLEYLDYMSGEKKRSKSQAASGQDEKKKASSVKNRSNRYGNGKLRIKEISLKHENGEDGNILDCSESCTLTVRYTVKEQISDAIFGIGVFRSDGLNCYGTNTGIERIGKIACVEDSTFSVCFEEMNLVPGQYWFDIAIEEPGGIPVDYYKKALGFEIVSKIKDVGVVRLAHRWHIAEKE